MNDKVTECYLKMILLNELSIIEFILLMTDKIKSIREFTKEEEEKLSKVSETALYQMKQTLDMLASTI